MRSKPSNLALFRGGTNTLRRFVTLGLLLGMVACLVVPAFSAVAATAPQDPGYLAKISGYPFDGGNDLGPWQFDVYECTSYVAYRLNLAGVAFHEAGFDGVDWGNASTWINAAATAHVPSGQTPVNGAVAVWSTKNHVAFVDSVTKGVATFSEYNAEYTYDPPKYNWNPPGYDVSTSSSNPSGTTPTEYIYFPNAEALPSPPQNLSVTRIGDKQVLLKWNPPSQTGGLAIDGYKLETIVEGSGWQVDAPPNGAPTWPALPDQVVVPCSQATDCQYKIAAITDAGDSPFSAVLFAKNVLPGPPGDLNATRIGNQQVLLKWNPPSQTGGLAVTGYEIEITTEGNGWQVATYAYPDVTTWPVLPEDVVGCSKATDCQYKVAAITDAGDGPFSAVATAKNALPGPPGDLIATRTGNQQVLLKWNPPSQTGGLAVTGYEIETTTEGNGWQLATYTYPDDTTWPVLPEGVVGCSKATNCQYKVAAITDAGDGPFSSVASVQNVLPGAPTFASASVAGNGEVLLKWNPPLQTGGLAINGYEIESTADGSAWNIVSNVPNSPDLPELVVGCSPGSSCDYKVAAVTDAGDGPFSPVVSVHMPSSSGTSVPTTAPSDEAPSSPTGLSAQRVVTGVLLQWSAPAKTNGLPINYYEVYLSTNGGKSWTAQDDSVSGTVYVSPEPTAVIDRSCGDAKTCTYELRAFTAAGSSGPSAMATAANHIPSPPTGLGAERVQSGVLLQWNTPQNFYTPGVPALSQLPISYYEVYLSTNNGRDWNPTDDSVSGTVYVSPEPTAVIDTSCGNAKTCTYELRAFTAAGSSGPSATATAANHIPSPPTSFSAQRVQTGVLLQWKKPAHSYDLSISYYEVYLSTNSGRDWSPANDSTYSNSPDLSPEPTALIDKSCGNDETCMYRISAFTAAGSSGPSATATAANHVPSPPTGLSAQRVQAGVLLQWNTPAHTYGLPLSYYEVYLSTNSGRDWTVQMASLVRSIAIAPEPTAVLETGCGDAQTCIYRMRAFTPAGSSGPSNTATVGG